MQKRTLVSKGDTIVRAREQHATQLALEVFELLGQR